MLKRLLLIIICALASSAFCEPTVKYEVATIVDVKPHQSPGDGPASAGPSYDVSLKVGDKIYLTLYTDTWAQAQ